MSRAILQVMIRGRVQGVGYRAWVEHQATTCGLEGWVRNRRDGSVRSAVRGAPSTSPTWSRCAATARRPRAWTA